MFHGHMIGKSMENHRKSMEKIMKSAFVYGESLYFKH